MRRFRLVTWIGALLAALASPGLRAAQEAEATTPAPVDAGDTPSAGPPVLVVRSGEDLDEAARAALAGVTAVEVDGRVPEEGNLAHLSVTLSLYARGAGPHRVPIGLDGLYPREAVSDGEPLAWEAAPPEGWIVILPGGPGAEQLRTVRVDVVAPVRSLDDRKTLALAIPRAASTRIRLDLPGPIEEASLGDGAPLPVEAVGEGERSRIEALLDARSELEIRWLPRRDQAAPVPPLVTGGGHVAVEVSDGALMALSTWEIQARRGEISSLVILPGPEDEVLEVEVDGRSVLTEPTADGRGRLIPLPRTLRKGDPIRVNLTTRRPIPPPPPESGLATVRFEGHPFEGLIEQSGTLSIGRADGLRILSDPERGLRRIDPRDLREEVTRTRPTIVSAFRFSEQPFALGLRVGPLPPMVRVAQRSVAALEPGGASARVESWLDYRSVRGQCFAVRVEVPHGLDVERVGPPEAIGSWDLVRPGEADDPAGPSTLEVTLATALREGQLSPLRIELIGRARLDPGRPPVLPLFLPLESAFDGGRLAVVPPPDLDVAAAEPAGEEPAPRAIAVESTPGPTPGPWARSPAESGRRAAWLRFEAPADAVPLVLSHRAPSASSMIDQLVRVGRDGIDVQQDLTLYARDGEVLRVDLAVPPELERGWELIDRGVVEQEEPISSGPEGPPIRRLTLAPQASGGPLKVRLRFRLPGVSRLDPGRPASLVLPRIEVLDPRPSDPPRVEVAADPGIDLVPTGDGWRRPAENQWVTNPDGGPPLPIRQVWVRPPGEPAGSLPRITATASAPASMPEALASRLWLRTEQAADGGVRTAAWFRFDVHGPSLGFRIPQDAELDRAYLNGEPVPADDLDALERPGAFLLHLPAETPRGVILGLSYRIPRSAAGRRWDPPRLLGGGRVLETLWEVRVPWSRALLGVPGGYTDENVWYWGGYVWKRRPGMSASELVPWIAGPGASAEALAPPLTGGRIGDHGYLFSRPGAPERLASMIVSRAALVGCSSGIVLLFGLLALVRAPVRARLLPAAAALALAALILMGPSTAVVVLQSSVVGWLLVAVAIQTRRAVDRRRPAARFGDRSGPGGPSSAGEGPSAGGSGGSFPPVGSDDSTAIRPRPQAIGAAAPLAPPNDPGPGDDVIDIPPPRADREAS